MGLFSSRRSQLSATGPESRAVVRVPGDLWFDSPYYPTAGSSYAEVDTSTAEASLQSVAVRSAVDLIGSLGSELPVHVYSGEGRDRRKRPMPGYLEDPAGDGYGLADWCYQALNSWLLRGNLYGDILDVSSSGLVTQVALQHPDAVSGWIDDDGNVHWTFNGSEVPTTKVMHRRVNPMPGRVLGLSPVALHARKIGLELTATRFGEQWFKDGAHPSSMLTNEEIGLDPKQIRRAKDLFLAAVYGTREPLVMGKGWKYQAISVSPEESQFLATQGFSAAECARIFGPGIAEVLGYESGGSLTYSNVESRSAHLLVYSVNKWLRRLERLLSSMLPRPQYVLIDRDGILQSTTLERYKAHESALKNRWRTVNEVRDDEDEPPVPWGDEPNTTSPPAAGSGNDDDPTGAEIPKKGGA